MYWGRVLNVVDLCHCQKTSLDISYILFKMWRDFLKIIAIEMVSCMWNNNAAEIAKKEAANTLFPASPKYDLNSKLSPRSSWDPCSFFFLRETYHGMSQAIGLGTCSWIKKNGKQGTHQGLSLHWDCTLTKIWSRPLSLILFSFANTMWNLYSFYSRKMSTKMTWDFWETRMRSYAMPPQVAFIEFCKRN